MLPSGGSTWWAATSGAPPRSTAGLWWLTRAPPFSSARWARTEFAGRPATSIHVPAAVNVQRRAGDVAVNEHGVEIRADGAIIRGQDDGIGENIEVRRAAAVVAAAARSEEHTS